MQTKVPKHKVVPTAHHAADKAALRYASNIADAVVHMHLHLSARVAVCCHALVSLHATVTYGGQAIPAEWLSKHCILQGYPVHHVSMPWLATGYARICSNGRKYRAVYRKSLRVYLQAGH